MRAVKKKIRDEASRRRAAKEDVPRDAASDAAADEKERKAASSPPPGGRFDLPSAPFARTLAQSPSCGWCPTLLLVPLVLGLEKTLNPRYVPSLVAALGLRQSVGVLGGRPGSSLYFVGAQDERLFYLDPHTVQPALEVSDGRSDGGLGGAASPRELKKKPRRVRFSARTYRCASTLNMDGRDLDPSMALGFYCRAESDFDELCLELELMSTRAGSTPICTVCRKGDEDEKAPPSVKATSTEGGGPSVSENLSGADRDEARLSEDDDEDWEMI
jgi:cysteine protease ATG4